MAAAQRAVTRALLRAVSALAGTAKLAAGFRAREIGEIVGEIVGENLARIQKFALYPSCIKEADQVKALKVRAVDHAPLAQATTSRSNLNLSE